MEKGLIILFVYLLFSGCNKSDGDNDLELRFLNKEIVSYSKDTDKDSVNIVRYCLKNNSKEIYLINNLTKQELLSKKSVYCNGVNLHVYDDHNLEVKYVIKRYMFNDLDMKKCIGNMFEDYEANTTFLGNNVNLNYFGMFERNNIVFIHPNETIYFDYILNLNRPIKVDRIRLGYVDLSPDKKYYSKLTIASDSSNYRDVLPKDILQTIKTNKVKVYHGVLESKNTVPIKVLK
jgi:hypothetical protein